MTKYSKGFASRQWIKTRAGNEALDVRVLNVAAFQGLLTISLDLEREAAKFAAIVHAVQVGARPEAIVPQRRVPSAGVALRL